MFASISAFISALPEIAQLCLKLLNEARDFIAVSKANALIQKEILAAQKASVTKDTSAIEKLFEGN